MFNSATVQPIFACLARQLWISVAVCAAAATGMGQDFHPPTRAAAAGESGQIRDAADGWGPHAVSAEAFTPQSDLAPRSDFAGSPWEASSEPAFHGAYGYLERSAGWGDPLYGTSWLNRPWYVGWLFGGVIADDLLEGRVEQQEDLIGGYRLGYDFDHYWGSELRAAFAHVNIVDAGASRSFRTARHDYWDVHLLYYPWGDARWRPFASAGLGAARFQFDDDQGGYRNEVLLHVPLGGGVKYYFRNWLALRFTAMDNLALGSAGLETMHNFSLTADVEVHWGGPPTSYSHLAPHTLW